MTRFRAAGSCWAWGAVARGWNLRSSAPGWERYERGFAEGLDLLLAALSRDRVGAAGEFFRFREVPVVPRPRTRPHPPVVVAATSAATADLAAARGLQVLLGCTPMTMASGT